MEKLNKVESVIMLLGAALMVIGSGANVFAYLWAPYVFGMGAVAFVLMQLKQTYNGSNAVIRRLRRIMIVSDFLFLLSAALMFAGQGNPLKFDIYIYLKYIHGNWVVTLLLAAIVQMYTMHRISHEMSKEAKKT